MNKKNLNIQLAVKTDIPFILNLLKERCKWFRDNNINQWGDWYYTELYNQSYFLEAIQQHQLYVAKEENEVVGAFLLKNLDSKYWHDNLEAYYIHHFVAKVGYRGIGISMLEFIENLAKINQIPILRLDCMKANPKISEYWKNCGFEKIGKFEEPYEGILWEKRIVMIKIKDKILDFYKETSCFTDLGQYKEFAQKLPDSIQELCRLQRYQIIHPFDYKILKNKKDTWYGDMTEIPFDRLNFENDLFPTAQSILAELLRRNPNYSVDRAPKDKVNLCCREQAILLTSILKAKGISARVRSGFAFYVSDNNSAAGDHWITEYYSEREERWILVDADFCGFDDNYSFCFYDIPRNEFVFGAEAYLGLRKKKYQPDEIYYASKPITLGLKAAIRALFYDFHSLMNHEIIFLHSPKYIRNRDFELLEVEYQELDALANLMLNPDDNFEELRHIWNTNQKFRILTGGINAD